MIYATIAEICTNQNINHLFVHITDVIFVQPNKKRLPFQTVYFFLSIFFLNQLT